jgi:hypothetical protein
MKRLLRPLLVAFFMLAFSATAAFAQSGSGTVTGKAVRWNGDAIAGATMRALTGPLETAKEVARTTTAADGSYSLSVPAGTPYWIHIDTFGSWWGYSYQTPFTLRPGETISQVYFALGPRDVKEIALPAPVSNVGPAVGVNEPPPAATRAGHAAADRREQSGRAVDRPHRRHGPRRRGLEPAAGESQEPLTAGAYAAADRLVACGVCLAIGPEGIP